MDNNHTSGLFGGGTRFRSRLFPGEQTYFKENPNVAGMAAQDGKVILNPHSGNGPEEQASVYKNELSRLFMQERDFSPGYDVTPQQRQFFAGTPYADNLPAMRETIAARLLSGDPSAGTPTGDQLAFSQALAKVLEGFR